MGIRYLSYRLNRRLPVYAAASALILFEFLSVPYPVSPPDTPSWYFRLASEPGDFAILNLPMSFDRPGYLLYQTVHGKRLTVAYISREDPRTLVDRSPVLQEFRHLHMDILSHHLVENAPSVLDYLKVRYVVLDGYKMPGGKEKTFTERLAGEIFAGEKPVYKDRRLTVYEAPRVFDRHPFVILGTGWSPLKVEGNFAFRVPPATAHVTIVSPKKSTLTMHIAGMAGQPGRIRLTCCGTIWEHDLRQGRFDIVSRQLEASPGDNLATLIFEGCAPEISSIWVDEK